MNLIQIYFNTFHWQADKLNTYRFCDNVWTFMLKEVEFRENSDLAKVKLSPFVELRLVCKVDIAGGPSQDSCL